MLFVVCSLLYHKTYSLSCFLLQIKPCKTVAIKTKKQNIKKKAAKPKPKTQNKKSGCFSCNNTPLKVARSLVFARPDFSFLMPPFIDARRTLPPPHARRH